MLLSPLWYLKRPSPFLKPNKNNIQTNTIEANVRIWLGKASRIFDSPFKTRFRSKPYFPVSIFISRVLKKINKHVLSCHPVLGEIVKSKTKVFDVNFIFVSRVYDNHGPHGTHRHRFFCYLSLGEDEKEGLPVLLPFEKVWNRHESTWERPSFSSGGHLLKRVNGMSSSPQFLANGEWFGPVCAGGAQKKKDMEITWITLHLCQKHLKTVKIQCYWVTIQLHGHLGVDFCCDYSSCGLWRSRRMIFGCVGIMSLCGFGMYHCTHSFKV